MNKYFEGGGSVFISITNTRSLAVTSVTSTQCWLVESWGGALDKANEYLAEHRFSADRIDIYTTPRLCRKCHRHATVPGIFDEALHKEECLCYMEKTPCGVHK